MDFFKENKGFLITAIITLGLLIGGVFLFSKDSKPQEVKRLNTEILAPSTSTKTATGSAEITLVEFGDYQCPACGVYHPFVKRLVDELGTQVNFVFRHFPLSQHKNAPLASYSVIAAGKQEKYWEMHNIMFEKQSEWSDLSDPKEKFTEYAKSLNLNTDQFLKDIDSKEVKDIVQKDVADATLSSINATPTYFVNGLKLDLPATYEEFKNLVITSK